jgi:hypothetical protein
MTREEQNNRKIFGKAAWPFAMVILILLVAVEALPVFFEVGSTTTADWISFLYVSVRFGILPVACIAHAGMIVFRTLKPDGEKLRITQISSVVVSVGYLLLLYFHPLPLTVWK